MHSRHLEQIDYGKCQRWVRRALPTEFSFMVFDRQGTPLCNEDYARASEIGQTIAASGNGSAPGLQRLAIDGQIVAWHQSLGTTKDGLLGWAAITRDHAGADAVAIDEQRLAEVMEDLVASILDEYQRSVDLELVTDELGARYEELHLIYAIDQHVRSHANDIGPVFQSLLKSTAEHLNVDVVAFVRPSQDVCLHATSTNLRIHNLDLVLVEMRGDLFRFVQSSGEAVVLNSMNDPRRAYVFTDMPYKVLGSPVRSNRFIDGLVVLLNRDDKPDFSNSDRKLADVLANQLSSLSNTYLLLEDMHEFNEQMAKALIEAVEAKDPYTRGHSERVNFLSMEIGKAMRLPAADLANLHWGSLLHDIGKIGIPDAVLCKPGPLTKDEFTFIKVHSDRSYEILRHIKQLDQAIPGARHHHERFDGTGYPHGLKGERIPLHARIIAIPDTYDSITSSRAYRAGRSHEVAMDEIEKFANTQFDPAITEVFKRLVADEPEWLGRFNIRRDRG